MSNHSTPVIRKPAQGGTIAVVGDVHRFLVTGDNTNGKYVMWEAIVPPGGGTPPHTVGGLAAMAAFVIAKAVGQR